MYAIDSIVAEKTVLAAVRAGFPTREEPPVTRHLTYYDTFDHRLYDHGTMLASSVEGNRPVLAWRTLDGRLLHRALGLDAPGFARELPEGPFRSALIEKAGARRLLPLVAVETRVRGIRVLDKRGKTVVRAAFERGFAADPESRRRRRLAATLTVSPLRGYEKAGQRVSAWLEREGRLEPLTGRPLERALAAIGRDRLAAHSVFHVPLDPSLTMANALRAIFARFADVLRRNEPGVRGDLDPEFLHDFRVAIRRTRTLLGEGKHAIPRARRRHFREEFKWLGTLTGPTRDLDVYLEELPAFRAMLPVARRGTLASFEALLQSHKQEQHALLVLGLQSRRYSRLIRAWSRFLERDWKVAGPRAASPVTDAAASRIRRAYRRAIEHGLSLAADAPAERLHRLRIDCKKLRYLLESFETLFGEREVLALVKPLKKLQDSLGNINDGCVQRNALEGFAHELASEGAEVGLALGCLIAGLEAAERQEREHFAGYFRTLAAATQQRRVGRLFGVEDPSR